MAKTQFKLIGSEDELYLASDLYTKTEVDNKIGSAIHYKGSVAAYTDLPSTGQQVGDMWNVKATGKNYVWAENPEMKDPPEPGWDDISTTVDLSNYYTKSEVNDAFATTGDLATTNQAVSGKQDKINLNSGILKASSNGIVAAVAGTDYVAPSALNNYVPTSRTINSKALSGNITLGGADIITQYSTGDIQIQTATINEAFTSLYSLANSKLSNAISNIKVGNTTISGTSGDTIELVASGSISITPDSTNKKITISSSSDVTSVNGKTGTVVLSASDVSALALSGGTITDDNGNSGSWITPTLISVYASNGQAVAIGTNAIQKWKVGSDPLTDTPDAYLSLPDESGTLALSANSLSGYGITDAKIENGTITLGNQSITPLVASDISDMATKTWVGQQGYLTSSSISDMATKTWVGQQGYLKAADVSDKVDKSTLTTYLTTGSGGVLEQFPTTGYNLAQLVAHYNVLLGALENIIGAIS